ncbi:MAG: cupin domain-containing protein [Syntrophobacteraceae bacterium]
MKSSYDNAKPYITKDGSEIRELMRPSVHGNSNQSLAEAIVLPGASTETHRHHVSEELYYITQGVGTMTLGKDVLEVRTGDVVCIPPGSTHNVRNTGKEELKILCCCSPPYSHEDTELIEQ